MARTPSFKGGEASLDKILEREENKYGKIEISDFNLVNGFLRNFKENGLLLNFKKIKFRLGIDTPCFRTVEYFIPFIGYLRN